MSDKRDGQVDTCVHNGVDLAALATKHTLWIWKCRVCGQEELIKEGDDSKPCFRCNLNSGAFEQRIDEARRLGDERRARELLSKGTP